MINTKIENKINTIFWNKANDLIIKQINKLSEEELEYLKNRYTDSRSLKESVYRIKYNIEEIPRCPTCGNFNNFCSGKQGYSNHCCCRCTQLDPNVREKNKQTNLKLYGVENGAQSEQSKRKYIEHIRKKYNDDTITNAFQAKEVIQKIKETCIKKYGYTNFGATPNHQAKLLSKEVRNKIIKTKQKNHTFNTSKSEDASYILLKEKYKDVKRNYKSKEYPFMCDFYIPSLDLYIECNYHWTHGGHPFNENSEQDVKLLNIWKDKNSKYYNGAIRTWTERDVNKRKTAKENNLNYIEFWDIKELKEFLSNSLKIFNI